MDNIFDKLFEISDTADSLDKFINENMQSVNEFYNSDYRSIFLYIDSIERFILFKHRTIAELNYEKTYTKSFVLMLLEYCERFNLIGATPHIYSILNRNDIQINSRMQAALLFLYPKPTQNSDFVDRFDSICETLQFAIDNEEDNDKKAIATFLNYYGIVINDTNLKVAEEIKLKIVAATQSGTYNFFQNEELSTILDIELQDSAVAYKQIQNVIDKTLGKEAFVVSVSDIEADETVQEFLIETDTDYSRKLMSVPNSFDCIRDVSVKQSDGSIYTNRGVKIPESEKELFAYMRRVGNMHKAKLQVALDKLSHTFPSKVRLIDWGCGQGIASMIFLEKFGNNMIDIITLIEPSEIALKRAALHCKKYCADIPLKTICKKLDNLEERDFDFPQLNITVHFFSNILDIDDYSQSHLIELIEQTQSGKNYFVCASPYIDAIKAERLESFKRHFESKYDSFELLFEATNGKGDEFWCCNNSYKNCTCLEHPENGCHNKWTRVIKVFKVILE
ncbi:hypothetical protein AGMMS50239_06170 [Bacteroidia bacterium]|nr:hypothetical protein AGMMS50239_06170 [Bacteroidia bacterium]